MPQPPPRRRFIAGAVCPRCGLQDKIAVDLEADCRLCVSCGFSEERPSQTGTARPAEPATRVSRAVARRVETPAEAINLVETPFADEEP